MFFLKGIPIYFRKLNHDDLKNSFYNLMSMLSEKSIELINYFYVNKLNTNGLFDKLNYNYYIFTIINVNTNFIIGTGVVEVLNKGSLCNVCIIKDIYINKEYEKYGLLYDKFLDFLKEYSILTEKCVKYILK